MKSSIEAYLKKNMSSKRFEHSISTARTAEILCRIYGMNEEMGYIAGLVHDIGREMKLGKMVSLARKEFEVEAWELENPKLLHGKAGAVLIRKEFRIREEEILNAVAFHTLGHPLMMDLGKVIYISDYVEPRRKYFSQNLYYAIFTVLYKKLRYLEKKGRKPAPPTLELYNKIQTERCLN